MAINNSRPHRNAKTMNNFILYGLNNHILLNLCVWTLCIQFYEALLSESSKRADHYYTYPTELSLKFQFGTSTKCLVGHLVPKNSYKLPEIADIGTRKKLKLAIFS